MIAYFQNKSMNIKRSLLAVHLWKMMMMMMNRVYHFQSSRFNINLVFVSEWT